MKKRLLCSLLCVAMLLGMLPGISLTTAAQTTSPILTNEEIANLPLASTAAKNDGIRAYKIDSVDELIAAARAEFVSHITVTDSSYSSSSQYVHGAFYETGISDRGDYSTLDTIYITADLDIGAWIQENPDKNFAELFDGFNANGNLYTTLIVNFDGQGHTIKGFTDDHALICGDIIGSVKNLKITDASVTAIPLLSSGNFSSAVLCRRSGVGGVLVENVHMDHCHLTTTSNRAGLFIQYPYGAGRNLHLLNCSINNSSVTSTYSNAQGIGLFLGDFGGNYFTAYNCVAANSTVTVPSIKTTDDGCALLFGTFDNGGQVKSVILDNIGSFNNTFITNNTNTVGIIGSFGNVKNAPVVATNIYAVNNQAKAAADAQAVPLSNLFMVVYDSYVKSVSATNTVTDYPVGMAFGQVSGVDKTIPNAGFSSNLTVEKALTFMNANPSSDITYLDWTVTDTAIGTTEAAIFPVATFKLLNDTLHFTADANGKVTFSEEEKEMLSSKSFLLNNTAATIDYDNLTLTANTVYTQTDVVPNYDATYPDASGISFSDNTHQLRMEKQLTKAPLTVSALIKADEGESGRLLSNYFYAGDASEAKVKMSFGLNSSGQPYFGYTTGTNTENKYTATNINLQGEGWVHLTAVFDHNRDTVYWYVNGAFCDRTLNATAIPKAPYQPLKIGGDYYASVPDWDTNLPAYNASYFKGEIGYMSIWSSVRTEKEIAAEVAALQEDVAAIPTTGDDLLGSWSFAGNGDVLTTTYADQSANGNNVTPFCELLKDYGPAYLDAQNINPEIAEGDYSIVLMPDIQNFCRDWKGGMSEYLDDYMQWIVDNQKKYNILAYMSLGDLVQHDASTYESEWDTVQAAFSSTLEKAGIPGVPMRGNHDRSAFYAEHIDYDHYVSQDWFGGVYEEGYLDNSYWFIETGDVNRKYLVFSLGWSTAGSAMANDNGLGKPGNETEVGSDEGLIAWVNETIAKYPDYNVIITAHNGMSYTGSWTANGQNIYDKILSKNDNIVFSAYGHIHSPVAVGRTDLRADGVSFPSFLMDAQQIDSHEGTKGLLGILTFKHNSDEAMVNWYSVRDGSLYRADSQFTINVPHVIVKSNLSAQIEAAEQITNIGYSEETWTALQNALAAANAIVAKDDVTQEEVDTAENALKKAMDELHIHSCTTPNHNDTHHWSECACEYKANVTAHTMEPKNNETHHWTECACGNKTAEIPHDHATPKYDATNHWKECSCGHKANVTAHSFTWVVDQKASEDLFGLKHEECTCGAKRNENTRIDKLDHTHTYGLWQQHDAEQHKRICTKDIAHVEYQDHAFENGVCTACGYEIPMPFADVTAADWFYGDVKYAFHHGLMNGITAETFAPNNTTTRAMVVTLLYRLEGEPEVQNPSPFTDVTPDLWFYEEVLWAAENGIVEGYGNGLYGPDDEISREQLATILYRYATRCGYDTAPRADLSGYTDKGEIATWAEDALSWANAIGLIKGRTATTIDPKATASRAELATMLHRFCEKFDI